MLKYASALNKDVAIHFGDKPEPAVNHYSLRLYDEDLLTFSMEDAGLSGMKTKILWLNEDRKAVFPLDLELTDDGIYSWLQKRSVFYHLSLAQAFQVFFNVRILYELFV